MHIILLSGGSGSRLWPLSNEVRSKQFLKILKNENGIKESMVQRVYRMIKEVDSGANITIATSENQVPQIREALGNKVDISIEPCRRDTFPAIALSVAYLVKKGVSMDEPVIISPVDPYVDKDYFKMFKTLNDNVSNVNITLMGIKPTYPSEKYGYIIPYDIVEASTDIVGAVSHASSIVGANACEALKVSKFIEKPNESKAKELILKGALWNSGVYAFKLSYILKKSKELLGFDSYDDLFNNYEKLKKISIDYAVAENEKSIQVVSYNGKWKDLGTWNTVTEAMTENINGEANVLECSNTHIINELSIPIVSIGINNAVIVATPDGILVSDKNESQKIKELVKDARPMYEKRSWGEYKVLDYKVHPNKKNSLTKELIVKPGEHISYQTHNHRMEIWTVVDGEGVFILDEVVKKVQYGDVLVIKEKSKHGIKASSELHIIEVQVGDELTEDDIERIDYDWEKV